MDKSNASELLGMMDQAPSGRFHLKTILVAGMGFFTDAYDLFILGTALPIIEAVFHVTDSTTVGLIGASALFGAFVGAILFGQIADRIGRKAVYGIELMIMVVFALVSAFSVNVPMLIASRFLLGIGVGGDYPISSTLMSEYANVKNRGRMVSMVFAMQGFGLLFGALVGLVSVHVMSTDIAWRFMLGFGAVPALGVVYLRRKISETPRYSLHVKGDVKETAKVVKEVTGKEEAVPETVSVSSPRYGSLLRKYWVFLIGTAGSWFLFDMAFYGTSINNGLFLTSFGLAGGATLTAKIQNIALGNAVIALAFEVPGYWIAVGLIDKVGRKALQWIGFLVMGLAYLIIALRLGYLQTVLPLFLVVYGASFLFGNIGPNTTTFIFPTELYPTQIRTTGHGISAGAAKFGAGIFTFLIPVLTASLGTSSVVGLLAMISFIGTILTLITLKETKGKSLEEASGQANVS